MNKPDISRCNKLIDDGFSLLTVGEGKKPNFTWKYHQTHQISKTDFEKRYHYSGGEFFKQKQNDETYINVEIQPTLGIGIITGFNDLEVIDIDLKVYHTLKEQQDFWDIYLTYLKESIDDFENKVVIYKTINNGYHLLYKCTKIAGNLKIAKLEGMKEAIIESRGIGGYVWIYDNKISVNGYDKVKYISEKERDLIWEISKHFNYIDELPQQPIEIKKEKYTKSETEISTWEDYNSQNRIWDLVSDQFSIVKKLSDRNVIRRNGATSATSGSIFTKDNKMFLFTTGTEYPNEKPLSPFDIYSIRYCSGDYKRAAKELYSKNYGTRFKHEGKIPISPINEKTIEILPTKIEFPIEVLPQDIQTYIKMCNVALSSNIDYMGCSFLWMLSLIIGNSAKIRVANGWNESAIVWISLVGEAGIGKTPSISRMIYPLEKINNKEIKKYIKNSAKFEAYNNLDKKEKEKNEEVKKPTKSQIIVSDFTIEAITDLHEESKNGVGIFCDELAGWYKDMNKYRAGSDLEFWLSSWSNKGIAMNRKTAKSSFVESPILPVLGGIQPRILVQFFTEENKDNGFIDRMLTTYPDAEVDFFNDNELEESVIEWYNDYVVNFYGKIKHEIFNVDAEGDIKPVIVKWNDKSKAHWKRIFNNITTCQRSDDENEYMKSMYPKQKSYIPRFALMLNVLDWYDDPENNSLYEISEKSILGAEKLSNYFVNMAKKHKISTIEYNDVKSVAIINKDKTTFEKIDEIMKKCPTTKVSHVANILGVSRQTVYNFLKEQKK